MQYEYVCIFVRKTLSIHVRIRKTSVHALVGLVNLNQILVSVNIRCTVEMSVIRVY